MHNLSPSLGFVTISFNQAEYLSQAIESMVAQMYPQDRLVIVDPGSKDRSREIIAAQAAADSRVVPVFEADEGPADGLNRGFSRITTDLCAYVNADDFLLPDAIAFVKDYFHTHPRTDVLIGAIKIASASGKLRLRGRVADQPSETRLLADMCQYYQQGTFFKRQAFLAAGGFRKENRTCWDRELMVDMALSGAKIAVSSRPLGVFRLHALSITGSGRSNDKYAKDLERMAARIRSRSQGKPPSALVRTLLRMEASYNPLRVLKQLRPVSSSR